MKELHLKAYEILIVIERLKAHNSEINSELIDLYSKQYESIMDTICELRNNPVFMRFTLNPEPVKPVVIKKEDQKLGFNETMENIFKQLKK